jgi:hypothetical protein
MQFIKGKTAIKPITAPWKKRHSTAVNDLKKHLPVSQWQLQSSKNTTPYQTITPLFSGFVQQQASLSVLRTQLSLVVGDSYCLRVNRSTVDTFEKGRFKKSNNTKLNNSGFSADPK